jgi:hypothetical protein
MKFCMAVLIILLGLLGTFAAAQEQCVPFGGTIYGWHNGPSWFGTGDFAVGKNLMHADVVDPNTGLTQAGDIWLGTEEATADFGNGDKITLMTDFITEHMNDAASTSGVFHVNETGYFAKGTGRLKNAWGRFNLQGPFGPGVKLPESIQPGTNDGLFWIGQYVGSICGVEKLPEKK